MRADEDRLFYSAAGTMAAILLGVAMIPLRELTSAANLAFAFMALTILVAEFGGSGAALATALASALSLDFFLTQPYLRLSIEDKHDLIAFLGLAACGLVASALSSQRESRLATLRVVAAHRELLHSLLRDGDPAAPPTSGLERVMQAGPAGFALAGAVVRDENGHLLAGRSADERRPIPQRVLAPDTLQPVGDAAGSPSTLDFALPREGGRIGLFAGRARVGWLDVWGDGRPLSAEARRALSDVARLIALLLVARGPAPASLRE